jgi:hypothetical protein
MDNRERFFEEVKREYDKQFDIKERIEGKASTLLTICGIVIPLLFGFSSFLIEKMDKQYDYLELVKILITIGIFATIVSIFSILLLFRTKIYFDSINVDKIFKVDVDNKPDMTEINKIISKQDDEYLNHRIFLHIACIKKNGKNNDGKAKLLRIAQWIFGIGMTTIPVTVGILLFNLPKVNP